MLDTRAAAAIWSNLRYVMRPRLTRMMGRTVTVILLLGVSCAVVSTPSAAAAIKSASMTFDPNQPGPTFGNPATLPDITMTVSYDDQAGMVTVSETGGDPSYLTGWAWFDSIVISGTNSPEITIQGYWDYPAVTPMLTDSGVNGSLVTSHLAFAL
jgi:hypothetical protein